MDVDKLSPEQRAEVDRIRIALEQELRENATSPGVKNALRDLEDIKQDALDAISHAVKYSQNESLKTKIAMWVYDRLIQEGKASADPLTALLEGMEAARGEKKESSEAAA